MLEEGRALIESTQNWRVGKVFHKIVKTSARPKAPGEPAGWYCRVSEHGPEDATFDELWEKIGIDKANNEIQCVVLVRARRYVTDKADWNRFVEVVKKATLIKQVSPSQAIWSMYYRFSPPVSPRVFTVMQTIHLNEENPRSGHVFVFSITLDPNLNPRCSIIVSIPVDLSADPSLAKLEEKGVKARYVSVEELKELPDGKVEWRMATASRAEGFIPQFLTERAVPGSISHVSLHAFGLTFPIFRVLNLCALHV